MVSRRYTNLLKKKLTYSLAYILAPVSVFLVHQVRCLGSGRLPLFSLGPLNCSQSSTQTSRGPSHDPMTVPPVMSDLSWFRVPFIVVVTASQKSKCFPRVYGIDHVESLEDSYTFSPNLHEGQESGTKRRNSRLVYLTFGHLTNGYRVHVTLQSSGSPL